ncbi:MAG TPA: hypothetical protein VF158_11670 [Longimicrobiales bacterium]
MRLTRAAHTLALGSAILLGACGVRMFDRWDGRPVIRRHVAAPADALWARLRERMPSLGLVVVEIRPEDRLVEFDWVTAPGDGRLYLRCREPGPIGSASLKPRIAVVPDAGGSTLVIGSRVRATRPVACESTGQFEEWLLGRLEPAIVAAVRDSAASAPAPADVNPTRLGPGRDAGS